MDYLFALDKLKKYNQTHLLRFYNEISASEQEFLLNQIDSLNFSVLDSRCKEKVKGKITPIPVTQLSEIEENKEVFSKVGFDEIKCGKVGAVLLAGGMGTRLGSDHPKGMFNIGVTHELSIFECLFNNLMKVTNAAKTPIHLFIMTSERNDSDTRNFLSEKKFFGYPSDYVHFFIQDMAPASDYDGNVLMEQKFKISTSPNGNGGWYESMNKAGMLNIVSSNNIKWLNVFSVDNVLQRIADPIFIGALKLSGHAVGSKVIKKSSPDERVGVMCLEDGKPSIVEYYELSEEMRYSKLENGDYAYNFGVTLNYIFDVDKLSQISENAMPVHVVNKKIPCIDSDGTAIEPSEPNGYKYETLILDTIHLLEGCLVFEVERKREFAPVKNRYGVDSVETARELLTLNGVEI